MLKMCQSLNFNCEPHSIVGRSIRALPYIMPNMENLIRRRFVYMGLTPDLGVLGVPRISRVILVEVYAAL
jgi:hypothetical protein